MPQDLLEITLSDDQIATADNALGQLVRALPGLTALTPQERRDMAPFAADPESLARRVLASMEGAGASAPEQAAVRRDIATYDRLHAVHERVQALRDMLDDTLVALAGRLALAGTDARLGDRLAGTAAPESGQAPADR